MHGVQEERAASVSALTDLQPARTKPPVLFVVSLMACGGFSFVEFFNNPLYVSVWAMSLSLLKLVGQASLVDEALLPS